MTIRLRHAARLEDLARGLAEDLAAHAPRQPFATQTILVAHPGMARWLRAELAHVNAQGIAAGCSFLLPGELLRRLGDTLPGPFREEDRYRPEVLRLALYDLFGEPGFAIDGESEAERFRRAAREAQRFGRLAIYRGDWLESWQQGQAGGEDGALWRALRHRLGHGDRPARVRAIAEHLARATPETIAPLFVFGLGHCAPDLLELIGTLARQAPVTWYLVNPCRDYWLEFRSPKGVAQAAWRDRDDYLETGPPLLASLGGQSRALWQALLSADALEEPLPEPTAFAPGRLGALQRAIHEGIESPRFEMTPDDPSLRIHACASPLGELESVREALDAALVRDPALRPDEVVIMAVDPGRYRPWLDAVFGGDTGSWPLRVADLDWLAHEPWFQLVATLCDIAGAPVRRSAWLGVLGHPEVQRHWQLDRDLVAALARALDHAWGSFGIDGADRGDGSDEHSLGMATRRLWRRYAEDVPESDWALTGLAAEALAHAEGVLACMQAWRRAASTSQPMATWAQALRQTLVALCGPGLPEYGQARQTLFGMLADLEADARLAGIAAPLPFVAFRNLLEERLHAPAMDAPSPGGGIRFTGLVPFRSLPFRFIAVLGLEDGAFPRVDPEDGEDPRMRADPRLLDRDRRAEDRQLFLEALLNARETLHLAHVSRSPQDGSEQPVSTLVSELVQVLVQAEVSTVQATGDEPSRDWFRHQSPLPFAPSRFVRGTSVAAWWPAAEALAAPGVRRAKWPVAGTRDFRIRLSDLQAFLRHPGAWFGRQRLGLGLRHSYWRDPDVEPLDDHLPSSSRRKIELIRQAIAAGKFPDEPPKDWVALGVLPAGQQGVRAFAALRRKCAEAFGDRIPALHAVQAHPTRVLTVRGLAVGPWRLEGHVRLQGHERVHGDLFGNPGELLAEILPLVVAAKAGDGPKVLHLMVDWVQREGSRGTAYGLPDALAITDAPDWSAWLEVVLDTFVAAHDEPLLLPWASAKHAFRYRVDDDAARLSAAAGIYAARDPGSRHAARADADDPYWRLLIGEQLPIDDATFATRFLSAARLLMAPVFARMVA